MSNKVDSSKVGLETRDIITNNNSLIDISKPNSLPEMENEIEYKSSLISQILQGLCPLALYYPFYRIFLEKKFICFDKDFTKEKLSGIIKQVKQRGGLYCGFSSFILPKMVKLTIFSSIPSENNFIFLIPIYFGLSILTYPFLINSNLKAWNLPGYASMKSFSDISQLYTKNNFIGLRYSIINDILYFIPFLNLFCQRFETIRVALLYSHIHDTDNEIKNVSQVKNYLKGNKFYSPGRFVFNIIPHCYNLFFSFQFLNNLAEANNNKLI
jgi:hypothetical protein